MNSSAVHDCVNKLTVDKNNIINQFSKILSASKETQTVEKECEELQKQVNEALEAEGELHAKYKINLTKNEELKAKLIKYRNEIEDVQLKCKELASSTEVNPHDYARLETAKEMLNIGKQLTGVRWDYTLPNTDKLIKGYVANKQSNALEPFEINKENLTEDKIQIELWNKIQAASSADWSDLIAKSDPNQKIMNKENITQN